MVNTSELTSIADMVCDEFRRRKSDRADRERQWAEIDRQIAMIARPKVDTSGDVKNPETVWMAALELPKMAEALAIEHADAMRLLLPRNTEWYSVHPWRTDKFLERFESGSPVLTGKDEKGIVASLGIEGDEESVNVVVKSTMDHVHALYGFRQAWGAMDVEGIKYGSFAGRMVVGALPKIGKNWRGDAYSDRKIPMLLPVSIRNLYLDDAAQFLMQEGMAVGPLFIREYWQLLADIKKAANASGSKGWLKRNISRLEETAQKNNRKGHIHLLEAEGDFRIEQDGESILLENQVVTICVDDGPYVIRRRANEWPFRSYVTGSYQKDDLESPYGTSILMKGRPLQEAMSEAANRSIDAAVLNTQPPIAWDEQDVQLQKTGGPMIHPGAKWATDRPDKIKPMQIGDPSALLALLQGFVTEFEKLTSSSEPRASGELKSHTSAFANDLASSRGILRTEEYVGDVEDDPLKEMLYREYWLLRQTLKKPMPVLVNMRGMRGHIEVTSALLPEHCDFEVHGSRGVVRARERRQNLVALVQIAANLAPLLAQMDPASVPQVGEIFKQLVAEFDFDADRFAKRAAEQAGAAAPGSGVQADLAALAGAVGQASGV